MAKHPELLIVNGELKGRRFSLDGNNAKKLRLGRSSMNDIHIPDEQLSRNHCLFEANDEGGIQVIDLSSANGTIVNGEVIGKEPLKLSIGDRIEVGATAIEVVGEGMASMPRKVDLGLGESAAKPSEPKAKGRSKLANILWLVAVLMVVGAICLLLLLPSPKPETAPIAVVDSRNELREFYYEKVEADSNGIYRYELILSNGVLKVEVDDVPKDNRHFVKMQTLDEKASEEIAALLSYEALRGVEGDYVGIEGDPPQLESWILKAIYDNGACKVRVINAQEPQPFRKLREKLETFSKNQLGIWAVQLSREKLIALAKDSIVLGRSKWEDRDAQYGNLFGSVAAYREAIFYLDTVNPKPECIVEAREGMERSTKELEHRYSEQNFLVDRAINLGQWEDAARELKVLIEMIPDRNDERHRKASDKMLDVEKRMKGGK